MQDLMFEQLVVILALTLPFLELSHCQLLKLEYLPYAIVFENCVDGDVIIYKCFF